MWTEALVAARHPTQMMDWEPAKWQMGFLSDLEEMPISHVSEILQKARL